MEKIIVEEICKKYCEDEVVIKALIEISLREGFSLEETQVLLRKFYSKKK